MKAELWHVALYTAISVLCLVLIFTQKLEQVRTTLAVCGLVYACAACFLYYDYKRGR